MPINRKLFLVEVRVQFTLHGQYYGFWCPGVGKAQGIFSHGIDLFVRNIVSDY